MKKSFILPLVSVVILILIFFTVFYFIKNKQILYGQQDYFSVIVLPDTQKYVVGEEYADIFTNQTRWIADNKNKLNIKFIIHEGDIVDKWDSEMQWQRANKSMSVLDNNDIPYSVVPGNHDHEKESTDSSTLYYSRYFPVSRFAEKGWWGGNYSGNDNNYQLLTINGKDYIFLSLDFCPNSEEIKWVANVLENHSDRKAILTTHGYLSKKNRWGVKGRRVVHSCENTEYIWNDLIKNYENLQIVLCGHVYEEAYLIDSNLAGKKVHQILANYQDEDNGGNGWLRILKFVPVKNKVYVETYSPYLNKYKTGKKSQFSLNF